MVDLIKEIEELKLKTHPEETEYRFGFRDGNNTCVVSVKNILTQYNLITAPKQIKLSEVVSRLKQYFHKTKIYLWDKRIIGFDYIDYDGCEEFAYLFELNKNMTIKHIQYDLKDNDFKWLYALWIAGSEIIDDLEEKEHEED